MLLAGAQKSRQTSSWSLFSIYSHLVDEAARSAGHGPHLMFDVHLILAVLRVSQYLTQISCVAGLTHPLLHCDKFALLLHIPDSDSDTPHVSVLLHHVMSLLFSLILLLLSSETYHTPGTYISLVGKNALLHSHTSLLLSWGFSFSALTPFPVYTRCQDEFSALTVSDLAWGLRAAG